MKLGHLVVLSLAACPGGPGGSGPLVLESAALPRAKVGEEYSLRLVARGGEVPYRFSLSGGALPDGLSLASDGTVFGTPTEQGEYRFDAVVTDGRNERVTGPFAIAVDPRDPEQRPLSLVTMALPPAGLTVPYATTLEAAGGRPPYEWSVLSGALPDGLSLAPEGVIGGTATTAGEAEARIAVTDATGEARWRAFVVEVFAPPALHTVVVPIAVVGREYSADISFSGGPGLRVELWSGELPEGLELQPSGWIRGTPMAADTETVRLRVTDGMGQIAERRIRVWTVEDEPWESFVDEPLPPSCGEEVARTVTAELEVAESGMLARVGLVVDIDYENVGMLDVTLVAPTGILVPVHVGGSRVGGARSLHFLYERDKFSWGSFAPLIGQNPRGTWQVEVRILPDPGFGCADQAGLLERVALVVGLETSSEDYLRVSGYWPNNLIEGPFARVAGGGLDQHSFDLEVEAWSTGPNGIAEGGAGDDVMLDPPDLAWTTDLPAGVGTIEPAGHFEAGESTGQGTIRAEADGREIALPIDVVPPDWVP